jgi:hypothetical protein
MLVLLLSIDCSVLLSFHFLPISSLLFLLSASLLWTTQLLAMTSPTICIRIYESQLVVAAVYVLLVFNNQVLGSSGLWLRNLYFQHCNIHHKVVLHISSWVCLILFHNTPNNILLRSSITCILIQYLLFLLVLLLLCLSVNLLLFPFFINISNYLLLYVNNIIQVE